MTEHTQKRIEELLLTVASHEERISALEQHLGTDPDDRPPDQLPEQIERWVAAARAQPEVTAAIVRSLCDGAGWQSPLLLQTAALLEALAGIRPS